MSVQAGQKQPLLLLLLIGIGFIADQSLSAPTGQLVVPRLPFVESFESFDDSDSDGDADADADDDNDNDVGHLEGSRDQLRQLLGQQLNSAVAPLTTAPLALLSQRQPSVVAPRSGAESALRFVDSSEENSDESEDESDTQIDIETDIEADTATETVIDTNTDTDTNAEQDPLEGEYNPYRDNFEEHNADGSYIFGYSLPNGVRRWERGFYSDQRQHGLVVEGFYAEPRGTQYELRCYRADSHGYQPLAVEYLQLPPRVRRNELPTVRCLNFNR
ncbi:clumping factor A [Drosophila grimshawi]|uniref:GH12495 n=1 Tax=Drosophila grimshawi TaxID=7222 RepID=B4JJI6_DROGR|nr:clumping factor A [Drosophila grimshawi]EDV99738.1 GH12495 [Drosophila grimshawi]